MTATWGDEKRASAPNQLQPLVLSQHLDAVLLGLGEFRAGAGTGDHVIGLLRHRTRRLGAQPLGGGLGFVARHLLQRAGEDHGLAGDRRVALRLFGIEDRDFPGQPLDDAAVMALAEIGPDTGDHGLADLVDRVHLGHCLLVALGDPEAGVVKGLPRTVAARQRQRRGFADLPDPERKDKTLERNLAPPPDRLEQVAHRGLAVAFDLLQLEFYVARFQREDVGRLLHPAVFEKEFDLLFAETIDVEGAARGEQFQVLDLLVGAGEFAAAAGARALLPGRGLLAHHPAAQRTRTFLRELIGPGVLGALVEHHIHHLRDDIAGALDDDGIADPYIAALAQLLAVAADAPDVILVMQRDVLHDDAADADRLELADRGEGAGASDLDLDIPQHGHGALGRELVRDRPARGARHETEALLPVETVDLVDHAVDIVIELGALLFYFAMESDQLLHRMTNLGQRIGLEAAALEPADHAGLGVGRHLAHLPPGIREKAERPRGGDGRILLPQRARRRIARIGKDGIAGGLLPLVEREEGVLGHVDLAAHLADLRDVAALQFFRHVLERTDVGGDVLPPARTPAGA